MALEISRRNLAVGGVKLAFGALMVLGALAVFLDPPPKAMQGDVARLVILGAMGVAGVALVLSNTWLLIRRPIVLRATDDGVWFGAGPVIPWRDIAYVYESGVFWERYGHSGHTYSISFSCHRVRTVFKLPPFLWFTSMSLGNIRISADEAEALPNVLVAQLESLRAAAPSEPVVPDELPRATVRQR